MRQAAEFGNFLVRSMPVLVFIASIATSYLYQLYLWKQWTLFEFIFVGLYFTCGVFILPWKSSSQLAFSGGLALGTIASMVTFFCFVPK
jgi:hypothetical protein